MSRVSVAATQPAGPSADAPQQPKSSRWLLQQLVAPRIPEDFTVPMADFVLMNKKNLPVAWAGMSKDGALVRRQQPSGPIVAGAFQKAALAHPNNVNKFVAVAHYDGGKHRTLDVSAFGTLISAFDAGIEGCVGITEYVHAKGGDGSMYRCDYVVANASAPAPVMAVHKHVKHLLNVSEAEMVEGVTRSFQEGVNKRCEHYTSMIVDYLQTVTKYTVLRVVCDYVVDEQGQPRLIWMDEGIVVPRAVQRPYAGDEPGNMLATQDSTFVDQMSRRMVESKSGGADDVYAQYEAIAGSSVGHGWRGRVLIVDSDAPAVMPAVDALVREGYMVTLVSDGPAALNCSRDERYSVILLARDLPSLSGVEVTRIIRQREVAFETGDGGAPQRTPIVAFTEHTSADDLRVYMEVGMDGCICKPLEMGSLLNTVAAAIPMPVSGPPEDWVMSQAQYGAGAAQATMVDGGADLTSPYAKRQTMQESTGGQRRTNRTGQSSKLRGSQSRQLASSVKPPVRSSTMSSMPMPEDDSVVSGIFQLDAETAIPYVIMGKPVEGAPVFHFVVAQDIFDTCEVYQIFFRKIVTKYPGMRVLLYNMPGQAFTEWRKDAVLNNEYQAGVLEALLGYLSEHGNGEFALDNGMAPFYIMGVGNGGCVASYFAASYLGRHPNLRGVVLVNGFLYLDGHLAGVFHDCMNVFACTPAARPDLPVYFFSRYLFSPAYLAKVGAPLALNLYTAVHNPITLEGRIQLCQGALAHTDVRDMIENLSLPIIAVGSAQDGFIKPLHVQALVTCRGGEERSIKRVLSTRRRCCVVWFKAGHELMQEARKPLANLVEQLAVGYHEKNDVAFLPLAPDKPELGSSERGYGPPSVATKAAARARQRAAEMAAQLGNPIPGEQPDAAVEGLRAGQPADQAQMYEDKFLENMVTTLRDSRKPVRPLGARSDMNTVIEDLEKHKNMIDGRDHADAAETKMGSTAGATAASRGMQSYNKMAATQYAHAEEMQSTSYPAALHDAPPMPAELAEYAAAAARGEKPKLRTAKQPYTGMGYDTKTQPNQQLSRKEQMARAQRKREEMRSLDVSLNLNPEAAVFERRDNMGSQAPAPVHAETREYMAWRLKRNRKRFARIVEQVKKIQRAWRAYLGRTLVERMRQQRAALTMQRWWRGCMGRTIAARKRRELWAAKIVQRAFRGFIGRALAYRRQLEEGSALRVQKTWRGWRARRFVEMLRRARNAAAIKIQSIWRARMAMQFAWRLRDEHNASINLQRVWRGYLGRARARRERDKFLFSKSQSQSIEFGRQMLMEHKLHGTKLQSEVAILTKEKIETEEAVETLLQEIATFESGVRSLEKEMIDLSRAEAEAAGTLDEEGRLELRQNKMRLDREFGAMLVKIADRREKLANLEKKLQRIDATRTAKKEELQDLERKLVVLLEEQQRELKAIKIRQTKKGERLVEDAVDAVQKQMAMGEVGGRAPLTLQPGQAAELAPDGSVVAAGGGGGNGGGPTPQQRAEANALMSSTETMMKFGFMSMSLTYFSSLNMVRAMRQVGTANTVLANPLAAGAPSLMGMSSAQLGAVSQSYQPGLAPGAVAGQEKTEVSMWTVGDVANWLDTLSLGQYKDAFADAAVDGAFLFDLTDDDLRNTLGIQHALHRKKILGAISRLQGDTAPTSSAVGGTASMPSGAGLNSTMDFGSPEESTMLGAQGQRRNSTISAMGSAEPLPAVADAAAGLSLPDMMRCVRHNKGKKLATMLQSLPDKPFDSTTVKAQFVAGYGTQYDDVTASMPFHINMADDHGNTLAIACAQSGQLELLKILLGKGSNVNHQNSRGCTAMHFSCLYKFNDMSEWLVSPEGGAADDSLMSAEGLTCYDM